MRTHNKVFFYLFFLSFFFFFLKFSVNLNMRVFVMICCGYSSQVPRRELLMHLIQKHAYPNILKILQPKLSYNTPPLSCHRQITLSNIDEICPLAIPNKIFFISMHVPSLVNIPRLFLKLSSGNENMVVSRADNSVKIWRNLPISNPNPDLHKINAHTKFDVNPLTFTQVIIRKRKYGCVSAR